MKTRIHQYRQMSFAWLALLAACCLLGYAPAFAQIVPTNQLTVEKAGNGSGVVTSAPAGIDCGSICTAGFPETEVVVLTATPTVGHEFHGWSGDADCLDGIVSMNADKSCTATFEVPVGINTFWTAIFGTNDIFHLVGNVGIGLENPQQRLHVIGNIKADVFCLGDDCRTEWPGEAPAQANTTLGPVLIPDTSTQNPELRQMLLTVAERQQKIDALNKRLQHQQTLLETLRSLLGTQ